MSPAARLCGFLILLGVIFTAAYVAGARLGPVTTGHDQPARERPMNMGAPPLPPPPARGAAAARTTAPGTARPGGRW